MIMARVSLPFALAALALPASAHAGEPVAPAPAADQATSADAVDPQRLAIAHQIVDRQFPPGSYARLMNGSMRGMIDQMTSGVQQMTLRDVAKAVGAKPEDIAKLGKGSIVDVASIIDPAFEQRNKLAMNAMLDLVTGLLTEMEPGIRDAYAQAYARRFTLEQLQDIAHFFGSPTGQAYATNALTLSSDPAVMAELRQMMPKMIQKMPNTIAAITKAEEALPKPKKYADLSTAEKARLAQLLGISEAELEANTKAGETDKPSPKPAG